jgi:hypothetical protein
MFTCCNPMQPSQHLGHHEREESRSTHASYNEVGQSAGNTACTRLVTMFPDSDGDTKLLPSLIQKS